MNAMNDRRRRTTSPVATIGVDCATHCMHTPATYSTSPIAGAPEVMHAVSLAAGVRGYCR
jgi:hypothetical protein